MFYAQSSCQLGNSKNMEVLNQLNFLANFWSRSSWVVKQVPLKNGTLIYTVIQTTNELGISVKKTDFQLFPIIWKLKGFFFSTWTMYCYCHSFCLSRLTIQKRKLIYSSLNFFFFFFFSKKLGKVSTWDGKIEAKPTFNASLAPQVYLFRFSKMAKGLLCTSNSQACTDHANDKNAAMHCNRHIKIKQRPERKRLKKTDQVFREGNVTATS